MFFYMFFFTCFYMFLLQNVEYTSNQHPGGTQGGGELPVKTNMTSGAMVRGTSGARVGKWVS